MYGGTGRRGSQRGLSTLLSGCSTVGPIPHNPVLLEIMSQLQRIRMDAQEYNIGYFLKFFTISPSTLGCQRYESLFTGGERFPLCRGLWSAAVKPTESTVSQHNRQKSYMAGAFRSILDLHLLKCCFGRKTVHMLTVPLLLGLVYSV